MGWVLAVGDQQLATRAIAFSSLFSNDECYFRSQFVSLQTATPLFVSPQTTFYFFTNNFSPHHNLHITIRL